MSMVKKQRQLIGNKDWNCLIILDACRYDYFRKVYGEYFNDNGKDKLSKVYSAGSYTPKWVKNTFRKGDFRDTVFVSGNPFINSGNIGLDFDLTSHFYKIVDVWEDYWSEKYMTVLPEHVSKITRKIRAKYPEKNIISQFMQPHSPYLSIGPLESGIYHHVKRVKNGNKKKKNKARSLANNLAEIILGKYRKHKLTGFLNMREKNEAELVVERYGIQTLLNAYKKNLRIVLEEVEKLVNRLPGKSVITSDHGEFLGEDGIYGHPFFDYGPDSPLREVPWMEINNVS